MTGTIKQDSEGMAKAVTTIVSNTLEEGKKMDDGLDGYKVDETVFKVRIPYAQYLG